MTNAVDIPLEIRERYLELEFRLDLRIFSLIYSLEAKDLPNPFEIKPPSNNETAYHSPLTYRLHRQHASASWIEDKRGL